MGIYLQGMSTMACLALALFFLGFWRRTHDRLFLIFAVSFGLMSINRFVSAALGAAQLHSHYVYTLRFLAFLLILAAIIDKNRPDKRGAPLAELRGADANASPGAGESR